MLKAKNTRLAYLVFFKLFSCLVSRVFGSWYPNTENIWYFLYANPACYCCNMKFMTCEIYGYFKSCACEHDAHERLHPTVPAGIPRGSKHVDNVPYYRLYLMSCVRYYKMSWVTVHYTHQIQGQISVNHFITLCPHNSMLCWYQGSINESTSGFPAKEYALQQMVYTDKYCKWDKNINTVGVGKLFGYSSFRKPRKYF